MRRNEYPKIKNVLCSGNNILMMVADRDISAGMVVGLTEGKGNRIRPMKHRFGVPLGVALYNTESGKKIAVASNGCIVRVASSSKRMIGAGEILGCGEHGTVKRLKAELNSNVLGILLDDMEPLGVGRMMINIHPYGKE
jgi:hypothetical protein